MTENFCVDTCPTTCVLCCVVAQNRARTAVVTASRHPATLVINHQHTQSRSSTRLLPANRCLDRQSTSRPPLHPHLRSHHFLRCQLVMCINSQAQSHHHWMPSSMLATFGLSHYRGITHLSQVKLKTAIHFSLLGYCRLFLCSGFWYWVRVFRETDLTFSSCLLLLNPLAHVHRTVQICSNFGCTVINSGTVSLIVSFTTLSAFKTCKNMPLCFNYYFCISLLLLLFVSLEIGMNILQFT